MRRAASAPPVRAICLCCVLALACSDGGGRADIFGSPAPYGVAGVSASGGAAVGAAGAPVQCGPAPGSAGLGGTPDFGSEASNGAGTQSSGPAGAGGMSQAGQSGAAGSGGSGQPAPNGGSGGEATTGGVSAGGTGDSAGAAGSSSIAGPKICAEACKTTQDCRIGSTDYGFVCSSSSHRCEKPGAPCQSSLECVPSASFWFLDCDSDADCFYFDDDACVSVAGAGKCARLAPGDDIETSGCEAPSADALLLPRFGGAGSLLVCGDASRRCEQGACVAACRSHQDCTPARNGSVCDLQTGACRCVKDQDCGGLGVSHCNLTSGRCECAGSSDCEELAGRDVCSEGQCACSSAAVCHSEALFSGTQLVCE